MTGRQVSNHFIHDLFEEVGAHATLEAVVRNEEAICRKIAHVSVDKWRPILAVAANGAKLPMRLKARRDARRRLCCVLRETMPSELLFTATLVLNTWELVEEPPGRWSNSNCLRWDIAVGSPSEERQSTTHRKDGYGIGGGGGGVLKFLRRPCTAPGTWFPLAYMHCW